MAIMKKLMDHIFKKVGHDSQKVVDCIESYEKITDDLANNRLNLEAERKSHEDKIRKIDAEYKEIIGRCDHPVISTFSEDAIYGSQCDICGAQQ